MRLCLALAVLSVSTEPLLISKRCVGASGSSAQGAKKKLHFGYDDAPKLFTAMVHKVPLAFQQITAEITCSARRR